MEHAKSRPARRRRLAYRRTRLRRFGISNPEIRLLGLNSSPSKKNPNPGTTRDCGLKQAVSHDFRAVFDVSDFPQTIFNPWIIFAHFLYDSTNALPPPPALRRNILRRRVGGGGRGTSEKPGVVSLTKREFLSFLSFIWVGLAVSLRTQPIGRCRTTAPHNRWIRFL